MRELEIALQDYFKTGNPDKVESLLTSPNILLDSGILPDHSEIILEAVTVLDSLNLFNNGLNEPELIKELESIEPTSPLYSWRSFTLAINELYSGNSLLMTKYLNEVRKHSPIQSIIKHMYKSDTSPLYSENSALNSSIDALKEVINNSLLDLYKESVKLVFLDLEKLTSDDLETIVLTIIEESIEKIPLDLIQSSIVPFISLEESIRLMALGTVFLYPIKSIQYWFCYIIKMNFTTIRDSKLDSLFQIILNITKALIKEKYKFRDKNEKREFIESASLFYNELIKLYPIKWESSSNPLTNLKRALTFNLEVKNSSKETPIPKSIQGDLF